MKKIAVVTDSTADLPVEITKAQQIYIVPITVIVEGISMDDGDSEGSGSVRISREEFYSKMPYMKTFPTTAATAPAVFHTIFDRLFNLGYDFIVTILLSSDLSATYNNALLAAEAYGNHVIVVDSQQVSAGLGLQVLEVVDLIKKLVNSNDNLQADKLSHIIHEHLDGVRKRMRFVGLVDTLEYLKRSGRVNWAQAAVGSLMNVKLLIEVKAGKVLKWGQARTRRNGIDRIKESMHELGELERLAVVHTGAVVEEVNDLLIEFESSVHAPYRQGENSAFHKFTTWMTPIVGTHIGTNVLAIAGITYQP